MRTDNAIFWLVVVFPYVACLALLWALLSGKPAVDASQVQKFTMQETRIAVMSRPSPTATPFRRG